MISEDAQDSGDLLFRKLLGSTMGLAALGAALSDVTAMQKLVAVPALSLAAYAALSNTSGDAQVMTHQGIEVPVGSVFSRANTSAIGKSLDKTAASATALRNSALAGMAVPVGLGLDYLYNRHVKYRNHPAPQAEMGRFRRMLYGAGESVVDSPATSMVLAGLAGGAVRSGWRGRPLSAAKARLGQSEKARWEAERKLKEAIRAKKNAERAAGRAWAP